MSSVDPALAAPRRAYIGWFLGIGLGGVVALLLGLAWDALLHARDPELAHQEGVLSLGNPGHLLLAVGIAGVVVGLLGASYRTLAVSLTNRRSSGALRAGFVALAVALIVSSTGTVVVAATAERRAAQVGDHSHDTGLAQDQEADHAHNGGMAMHRQPCTGAPTAEQRAAAEKLASDTKAGIAPYADLATADAAGYRAPTALLGDPKARPTNHYSNPAYRRDGRTLDPSKPESLVYANTSRGPVLVGALYILPRGQEPPELGGCLTRWHMHGAGATESGAMLHVWTVDLPGGPFMHPVPARQIQRLAEQTGR